MKTVQELANDVAKCFEDRSKNQARALFCLKLAVVIFSACAGAAQFLTAEEGKPWSTATFVGICSSIIVALAGLFFAIADKDASSELETARKAVALAESAERDFLDRSQNLSQIDELIDAQDRSNSLYQSMMLMRGVIEQIIGETEITEVRACSLLLEAADRNLIISLGVTISNHYTLCVYKTEKDESDKSFLKCVAQKRTVDCPIDEARQWPSGVGVAGASHARKTEVVVPDLSSVSLGSLYSANQERPADGERYRSVAAVPVLISGMDEPWGVVVGTSDVPSHFYVGREPSGVQTTEAVRALAGMVALAVRVVQSQSKEPAGKLGQVA